MKNIKNKVCLCLIVIATLMSVTGCGAIDTLKDALSKEPVSYEEITVIAQENGLTVQDLSDDIPEDESERILHHYALVNEDESYIIEYYDYNSTETACTEYILMSTEVTDRYSQLVTTSTVKVNGPNYAKVAYKGIGNFTVVSYIGNTLIYIDVLNMDPDSAKEFLKTIGY